MKTEWMKAECTYELVPPNEKQLKTLYTWIEEELDYELYSCRPVNKPSSFDSYARSMEENTEKGQILRILIAKENPSQPLGQIKFFDYNERNQTAELGYYLPKMNREKKLGTILLGLFLKEVFNFQERPVNKVIATTSSNNERSAQLLRKCGFKQDGALRAHYWVGQEQYDQLLFSLLKQEFLDLK